MIRALVSMVTDSSNRVILGGGGGRRHRVVSTVIEQILFILAGHDGIHKSLDEFEIWPDSTTDYGVSCPCASEKNPQRLIMGKTTSSHFLHYFLSDPFHTCRY